MVFSKRKGTFGSSNGIDDIAYSVYVPQEAPGAVLQIAHGMSEHFGRYEEFAGFLAERGIIVCGNDHLGHGGSVSSAENLGYFGNKKGWEYLVDDMHLLTMRIKKEFGAIPYFLLGHSLGSLLARAYLSKYGDELSGCIIMGTSDKNSKTVLGKPLMKAICRLKGEKYRSRLLYSIAFGNYNKRYKKGCSRLAWMSQDSQVLAQFKADPMCNFILTVAGFMDLTDVLLFVSRPEWAHEVPKEVPLYLVSGDMDPVGDYGKGVQQVYKALLEAKVKELSMKLYPDDRHEILNEPHKETVYRDILCWLEKYM